MKNVSLLGCAFAAFSLGAAAVEIPVEPIQRVYCDVQKVFQQSAAGQELAQWSDRKNKELNELLSTKQNELRKSEMELASAKLPDDLTQLKTLNLEHAKRQASLDVERTKAEMERELALKMRTLEDQIRATIKTVAVEKKWDEVVPTSQTTALFFSEKMDKTTEFLEAFNKSTRAEAAKAVLRAPDGAKAPEILRA